MEMATLRKDEGIHNDQRFHAGYDLPLSSPRTDPHGMDGLERSSHEDRDVGKGRACAERHACDKRRFLHHELL